MRAGPHQVLEGTFGKATVIASSINTVIEFCKFNFVVASTTSGDVQEGDVGLVHVCGGCLRDFCIKF